jgi:hypothetical protein
MTTTLVFFFCWQYFFGLVGKAREAFWVLPGSILDSDGVGELAGWKWVRAEVYFAALVLTISDVDDTNGI